MYSWMQVKRNVVDVISPIYVPTVLARQPVLSPEFFPFFWRNSPPVGQGLLIQRRTTVGRTPLDEWLALSQRPPPDNTQHSRQTSMPPVGFESTISAGERPQTCALDRAATGADNQDF